MAAPLPLIPSPEHLQLTDGTIDIVGARVDVRGVDAASTVAQYARTRLHEIAPSPEAARTPARIALDLAPVAASATPGAYSLDMDGDVITITAEHADGLFYGVQTLLQLAEPSGGRATPRVAIHDRPLLPYRAVHIDFRTHCLMPTFDYLVATIKELARYKINAIVLEWEDKFPYQRHPEAAAPLALSPEQVRTLLAVAAEHHVQVIPLLQTLGHVEYILKHPRYAALRERAGDISQFCPCEAGSLAVITELLDEIMAAHPDATFIHLGGDETWLLGSCPRCAAKAEERGRAAVYLDHIGALCRHVLAAGKIPLIWGDVVIGQHTIQGRDDNWLGEGDAALDSLPREVRMVYWDYHGLQPSDFTHFEDYRSRGFPVWVAPTTRSGDIVPDYATHLPNISAFLEAGIAHGAEGAFITSWAWKNMPFEMTWHGLICGAERAWSGGRLTQDDLDARAVQLFYGTELPEAVDAMRLLNYDYWAIAYRDERGQAIRSSYVSSNPGHEFRIPHPERVRDNARRAQALLATARGKARRHADTLADWEVAARLVAHSAEKQMLFDTIDTLPSTPAALLDGATLARMREQFEALAQERAALETAWREMLLRTNMAEEVERDNALRFAGERAHTAFGLEQLRVFELTEGRRIWR